MRFMDNPVCGEVAGALSEYLRNGQGPTHAALTTAFYQAGLGDVAPYTPGSLDSPNKVQRLQAACRAAWRDPVQGRKLMDAVLNAYRIGGVFDGEQWQMETSRLRSALNQRGWTLTQDGRMEALGDIDLDAGGREALNEQLNRLRRNTEDAGLLLGTAKELLESIGKFVLEEAGRLPDRRLDFPEVMHLSLELLGVLPGSVDRSEPGAKQVQKVYQAVQTVIQAINELRNAHGTGHGRTLPSGVTVEAARFMIRQATMVAEMMLTAHDRQLRAG